MRQFSVFAKVGALVILAATQLFATIVTFNGNAYTSSGVSGTSNVRAAWAGTDPLLTWDNVLLTGDTGLGASECVSPCAPSYTTGVVSSNNVNGQTISGVTVTGTNTTAGGNNVLYVRPIPLPAPSTGARNPEYRGLNGQGTYTQWLGGFATAPSINGTPTITIALPTGTRSVGFDYGSISNLSASNTTGLTITTTLANTTQSQITAGRYDVNQSGPTYLVSGPGFYGVNSSDSDITTITITANGSSTQWILNVANIRFGTLAAQAAVPEPSPQLMLGAALISISLLLRHRSKSQRGGNA